MIKNGKRKIKNFSGNTNILSHVADDYEAMSRKLINATRDQSNNNLKGYIWRQNNELIEWDVKKLQIEARLIAAKNSFKLVSIQQEHLPDGITPLTAYSIDRKTISVENVFGINAIDIDALLLSREAELKGKVNASHDATDQEEDLYCQSKVNALGGNANQVIQARRALEDARDERKRANSGRRRENLLKIDLGSENRIVQIHREVEDRLKKLKEFEEVQQYAVNTLISSIDEQRLKPYIHDVLAFKIRKAWIDMDVDFRGNADSLSTGSVYRKLFTNYKYYHTMSMSDNVYLIDTLSTKLAQYNMVVHESEKLAKLLEAISESTIAVEIKLLASNLSVVQSNYNTVCQRLKGLYEELVLKGTIKQSKTLPKRTLSDIPADVANVTTSVPVNKKAKVVLHCSNCGKDGHLEENCWKKSGSGPPKCTKCNRLGHLVKDCYKDVICTFCGKTGHPEKVCRAKNSQNGNSAAATSEGLLSDLFGHINK